VLLDTEETIWLDDASVTIKYANMPFTNPFAKISKRESKVYRGRFVNLFLEEANFSMLFHWYVA
jgi:hypothetical protein